MSTRSLAWLASLALVACGPPSSMIAYANAAAPTPGFEVTLYADGDTLAARIVQPGLTSLVLYEPTIERGEVVLTAGLVSSGGAGVATRCFDVARLGAASGWADHVGWRDPDGSMAIATVVRGAEARAVIAGCAAR